MRLAADVDPLVDYADFLANAERRKGKSQERWQRCRSRSQDGSDVCTKSFTASTLVLMADGSWQPIELVQEGDRVWAQDPETGGAGPRAVVGLIQGTGWKDLVSFTMDGDNQTATEGHPFWVVGRGWIDAGDVEVGDLLLQADGGMEAVDAVHEFQLVTTVYNFEVAALHTYFVEVNGKGVLGHND